MTSLIKIVVAFLASITALQADLTMIIRPSALEISSGEETTLTVYLINNGDKYVKAPLVSSHEPFYSGSVSLEWNSYEITAKGLQEHAGGTGGISRIPMQSSSLAPGENRKYFIEWKIPETKTKFDFLTLQIGLWAGGEICSSTVTLNHRPTTEKKSPLKSPDPN
jgi:hypothetical protein